MFADNQHRHETVFGDYGLVQTRTLHLRSSDEAAGQARLVMRQRGNLRLLLNANLWPQMPVSMMDGGKASFLPFFPGAQVVKCLFLHSSVLHGFLLQ